MHVVIVQYVKLILILYTYFKDPANLELKEKQYPISVSRGFNLSQHLISSPLKVQLLNKSSHFNTTCKKYIHIDEGYINW